MEITRKSEVSGITRTMDLDVTLDNFREWERGVPSQGAFPSCTPDQREFIMTGIAKEEWDDLFGKEAEDG